MIAPRNTGSAPGPATSRSAGAIAPLQLTAERRAPLAGLGRWQLALPLALVLLALVGTQASQRLDWWLFDTLITHYPLAPPDNLSIIGIDESSLETLGRWPWPRETHARLIDQLSRAGADVVVFDVLFTEPAADPASDEALAAAVKSHGKVVLPLHLYPLKSGDALTERLPIPVLTEAAATLGHVHVELDNDGIARGLYLWEGLGQAVWPSLAVAALELADNRPAQDALRSQPPYAPTDDRAAPFVKLREHHTRIPLAGLNGAIPTYSYSDVLENRLAPEALAGKTLFVGATAAGFGDVLQTPLSGNAAPLSGVEFHANVYSALAQGAMIQTLPAAITFSFGALLILLITLVFPRLRPQQALGAAIAFALVPMLAALGLFIQYHYWLAPVSLAMVCLLAYPIWAGRRLAALNQFLNRQLEALAREPSLSLQATSTQTPTRLFEQLQELLSPRISWLATDAGNIRGARPEECELLPEAGRWFHAGDTSRIALHHRGELFELGLVWDTSVHDYDSLAAYLDKLALHDQPATHADRRTEDRLTRRIQQARLAAKSMEDLRSFVRQGFERMPDGVIVTDALGVIQLANGHVADWFSTPVNSLPGMPLVRLLNSSGPTPTLSGKSHWQDVVQTALTGQRYGTESLKLHGRDLLLHLAPFAGARGDRPGLIANVIDITDVREQQRQYREAIDFISHDVRSPLVSQLALIQQLKRQPEPASEAQLDHVARLAQRSYQLAEEFVQLARAEQLAAIQFYEAEVLSIAENAIDAVQEQARNKSIKLTLNGEEDLWMRGNAELAERAVINLLTNAIAYSPEGSAVEVEVQQDGEFTVIGVQDNGNGISAEELPRLFQRFQRSRQDEQQGSRGAGLGLAFVKVVAERHGGRVEVDSSPGQGSSFRLYLPVASVSTAPDYLERTEMVGNGASRTQTSRDETEKGSCC
ncbi:CHASE2 domain-containing protein [Hydrocarboniclastica marina]|uniref:histidine kinase n=1 Tax=Hydrocarboniclastica marina TaxID=2259620 RepID=A0A4P7XF02_9ALTE|nr:CHASE2 domain-containing protein [Hydrocarboniclastica marina]QCF25501.1 CHASE2 domain-containing protein [Hydrocarboniclastica marina]